MVDRLNTPDTETIMLESFKQRAREVVANPNKFEKDGSVVKVGLEVEYSLVDNNFLPVCEEIRDKAVHGDSGVLDAELGAAQIELHTDPIDVKNILGFEGLLAQLSERQARMQSLVNLQYAHVLSTGANPFVEIDKITRTNKLKYKQVPNFHNERRFGIPTVIGVEQVDVGDAAIVSLLNSVQANVEARGFGDAVDKLNRSLMISPLAVCLTANARYLDLKDTSCDDVRMIAWEISHDTRNYVERMMNIPTRVGLPERYYESVEDYLQQVAEFPFILDVPDHAFEVGIGLNWRDARIKFLGDSVVVEFRPVSTQSTPEQNTAAMAFYVGRMLWSQNHNEPLLPMDLVRKNKLSAMTSGVRSNLYAFNEVGQVVIVPARDLLQTEIERAIVGLNEVGIGTENRNRELLALLKIYLEHGTLSDQLRDTVSQSRLPRRQAIIRGLLEIRAIR